MSGAHAQPDANDNATWLFIKPSPYFHNSEPWWSALFSILLLHLARGEDNFKIPLKKCVGSPEESFNSLGEYFDCSDVKFEEVLVDAKLNPKTFPDLPSEFRDIRPDIMIHRPKLKRIALIENKTVGADLGEQLDRYHEVKAHLSKEGWSAEFFLLISSGYEIRREWRAVEKTETKLILWEDVLRIMDSIEFFRSIIGVSLKPYYEKWV
ncbi:MAG: hypothetical protein WBE20_10975 [Candidatus Acidiferrales bacterium]